MNYGQHKLPRGLSTGTTLFAALAVIGLNLAWLAFVVFVIVKVVQCAS